MTRMNLAMRLAIGVFATMAATTSQAVVNLKNGNFYIAYHDMVVDEESGLQLSRHYNSRSPSKGWFGWGWGTEFETRLFVMPDGLVAVRENGNAHVTLYGQPTPKQVEGAADRILQSLRKKGAVTTQQEPGLRQKLMDDPLLRLQWSERYQLAGTAPAVGTRLTGAEYQSEMDRFAETSDSELMAHALTTQDKDATLLRLKHAYVTAKKELCGQLVRTQAGYERATCSNQRFGDKQSFDSNGRLTRLNVQDSWLRLTYGKSPYPEQIVDEDGKAIGLKWTDKGLVSQISGLVDGKQRITDYSYDAAGNLIKSDAHTANVYRYQYDSRHNMTRIDYSDDKKKTLEYDAQGRVVQITQRDGQQAFFRYADDEQGSSEIVYLKGGSGEPREVRRLRYNSKGQLLLDRDAHSFQEYEYHPTLGTVTRIRNKSGECNYEYNTLGKITREYCPATKEDNFLDYDNAGNLSKVTLSVPEAQRERLGGKSVVLLTQYDKQGRLTRLAEMGESGYVSLRYVRDTDTTGAIEFHGFPEGNLTPRLVFGSKVSLLERATKNMEQRTRIHAGFVMVEE